MKKKVPTNPIIVEVSNFINLYSRLIQDNKNLIRKDNRHQLWKPDDIAEDMIKCLRNIVDKYK